MSPTSRHKARKRAKPIRRWALVENGQIVSSLIFRDRIALESCTGIPGADRRIAQVEIREVVPKHKKVGR